MLPNSKRIKQWAINIDYSWFVQFWKSQLSVQMATTTKKKEISSRSIDQSLLGMGAEIYRNSTKIETNGGALSIGTPCKLRV